MIGLVAAAMDNGFRVVVVLTSDNVKLVSQTTERFAALEGPNALDALNPAAWESDYKHIGKHLAQSGVVFVCSKNKTRLDGLIEFLERIGAPNYPALILDDEAESSDPGREPRSEQSREGKGTRRSGSHCDQFARRGPATEHPPASRLLQVTATPYALLLQSVGTELRPSFTRLLEPGAGYTGGEHFFEAEHVDGVPSLRSSTSTTASRRQIYWEARPMLRTVYVAQLPSF